MNVAFVHPPVASGQHPGRSRVSSTAAFQRPASYAADRIQWYDTYRNLSNGRFDFGDWEGQLWKFPPSGAPPSVVSAQPVDFSQIM